MNSVINNLVNCKPHGDCEININDNLTDDSRKIFVGGLSWETNEDDLKKYFSEFGLVKSCLIKLDRYTNHSRGFGFVIFESEDTVNKILERKEHILNRKKIDPKKAKPSREPQRKIFIGGLDPDLTESEIKEYFCQFGEIENIETPFDIRKNKRKAYIFVTFANENEARKAAAQEFQELNGKKFEVRIAIPREQANRGKNIFDWKGTNNSNNSNSHSANSGLYNPYTAMLPYMYPEYFYYMFNNPQLFNSFYNSYDVLGNAYDPINLSRQLSTGLMINHSHTNNQAPSPTLHTLPSSSSSSNIRQKPMSLNTSKYNSPTLTCNTVQNSTIDTQTTPNNIAIPNGIIVPMSSASSLTLTGATNH